jgi:hypothetical protein
MSVRRWFGALLHPRILVAMTIATSAHSRSATATEFFFYDPKPADYVAGYSVKLLKRGEVIGYPRTVSQCDEKASDVAACQTNFCRIRTQLAAWEVCRQKFSQASQDSLRIDNGAAPGPKPAPAPGAPSDPPAMGQMPPKASECFAAAADLISKKILVAFSAALSPEDAALLIGVLDAQLLQLRNNGGTVTQLPCQTFLSGNGIFPDLALPAQVRLFNLLSRASDAERSILIGVTRLALEAGLKSRVPRSIWASCFNQVHFSVTLYRAALSGLTSGVSRLCPVLAGNSSLAAEAALDLKENSP